MNKSSYTKNIAFTLAEMMVVLALFSVVSAATLPVVTARHQVSGSSSGGSAGNFSDPWDKNSNYNAISYYNSGTLANTSAVMVGGQITDTAASIGNPRLIVKDNYGFGSNSLADASQIVLLKRNNGTPYYAGRIMMQGPAIQKTNPSGGSSNLYGNVAFGPNALSYKYYGGPHYNVAIGSNALNSGQHLFYKSVAIGSKAGASAQARNAVLIGSYAGYGSSSGDNYDLDVSIGNYAGVRNEGHSIASVNIGNHAGATKIELDENRSVAIGTYSAYNINYTNSVAVGAYAGCASSYTSGAKTVNNSVFLGPYAGSYFPNYTINGVVAIGYNAGNYSITNNAVFIGPFAGYASAVSDYFPVAIGYYAGASTNYNANAVSIGNRAGYGNTPSSAYSKSSVFIGYRAGSKITSGSLPAVAIGLDAGRSSSGNMAYSILIGENAGYNAKNLYDCVCIGSGTCAKSSGGSNLVRIAAKDGYSTTSTNTSYQSHIGDVPSALGTGTSNKYWSASTTYDNLLITPLYGGLTYNTDSSIILYGNVFSASTNLVAMSDRRLKENIRPAKYGLNDIRKINIYQYNWKDDDTNTPQIGVIAQELQKVIPEGVHKSSNGYLSVSINWILYPMINAIKELDMQVQTMKNGLTSYTKEYVSIAQRVKTLEKEVKVLEKENKQLSKDVQIAYRKAKSTERKRQ